MWAREIEKFLGSEARGGIMTASRPAGWGKFFSKTSLHDASPQVLSPRFDPNWVFFGFSRAERR
jgi:hypothetical protein